MKTKRILLILSIILITTACYIFMNRNYDPLARYNYNLSDEQRALILNNLDQREIVYIVDYAIEPTTYLKYINYNNFNAYHISEYNEMDNYCVNLNDNQVVNVVELLFKRGLNPNDFLNEFCDLDYDSILYRIYLK